LWPSLHPLILKQNLYPTQGLPPWRFGRQNQALGLTRMQFHCAPNSPPVQKLGRGSVPPVPSGACSPRCFESSAGSDSFWGWPKLFSPRDFLHGGGRLQEAGSGTAGGGGAIFGGCPLCSRRTIRHTGKPEPHFYPSFASRTQPIFRPPRYSIGLGGIRHGLRFRMERPMPAGSWISIALAGTDTDGGPSQLLGSEPQEWEVVGQGHCPPVCQTLCGMSVYL